MTVRSRAGEQRGDGVSAAERERAPAPLPSTLAGLGNDAIQRAARDGELAAILLGHGAPLGNQAVQRMLVQRHPGTEKLKAAHDASAHASDEDRHEHVRAAQASFDDLDDTDCFDALKALAVKEGDTMLRIPLHHLPPRLQALILHIQATITELEQAIADGAMEGEDEEENQAARDRLRAHIKSGARSWHDDDPGMLPKHSLKGPLSPRADFFTTWRAEDKAAGRDTTSKQEKKQEKKGAKGSLLPFREYTAVGWKTAEQSGRLLYDPIDDRFYLSLSHYRDTSYFLIEAPRAPAGGAAPLRAIASEWDVDFLIFRAWERLAEELLGLWEPEEEEGRVALDEENAPEALECVNALVALRQTHAEKYEEAKKAFAKMKGGKAKSHAVPFQWCGRTLYVDSEKGYIGYMAMGAVVLPGYKASTQLHDVAKAFRGCLAGKFSGPDEDVALALAALVAEPSRHSPAFMEAVFGVLHLSPITNRAAFGTAFPMAAGSTIATGGVLLKAVLQEAALAREVIFPILSTHAGLEEEGVEALLVQIAETRGPAQALDWVVNVLRAALMEFDAQKAAVRADLPGPRAAAVAALALPALSPASAPAATIVQPLSAAVAEEEAWGANGPLTPAAVLELLGTAVAEEFWDGYDDFRFANPGIDFALTAYEALAYLDRSLDPFDPRPLSLAEQRKVEDFKARHPEFLYQEWG